MAAPAEPSAAAPTHHGWALRPWLFAHVLRGRAPTGRAAPKHGHHDARSVTRSLYGAIIVLAVLVTADHHAPSVLAAAIGLALTVAVVLGMEAYADVIGQEVALRRSLTGEERAEVLRSLLVVTGSAEAPLLFLLAAAVGLIEDELAYTLAEALTLALMFAYGFHARRLAGLPVRAALRTGLTVAGLGLILSLGKGYIHF